MSDYTFTGQYSNVDEFGLMYYGSRWYDPSIAQFSQSDSDVPESQGVQAFDRYTYANNNPLRYSDPSGHNIWDVIGQFSTGFVFEFARTNAWASPQAQNALSVSASESDAMLVGRIAADIATIVVGVTEVAAGITTASGGTVAACVGAVATVGAGAAVTAYGAVTTMAGAAGLGGNLALLSGGSGGNPNPWEVGDPINSRTTNGYPSWSTVQRRYWQNRAQNALPGEFSPKNLERMKNGLPPLHEEYGVPMELHHINGRNIPDPHNINNLREVWPWEHDAIDPYRHYNGPQPR